MMDILGRLWIVHGVTRWDATHPLATSPCAPPGVGFPVCLGASSPSPGFSTVIITISRFVHSSTGNLMLRRWLGGLVLRAEARSVVVLPTSLTGSFFDVVQAVLDMGCWHSAAVGMASSSSWHAAFLVLPPGPWGPARATAPRPRAGPLPVSQLARRGQSAGTRASTYASGATRVPFTIAIRPTRTGR